jgi:hypothetical protein
MNKVSQVSAGGATSSVTHSCRYEVKLIAMYFPQLHAIPENDEWWGKGFTDWNKVKTAVPMGNGHFQPRVPLNKNYYDQSQIETLRWQIDLAKQYGIYAFCHYHYWFDGKQLLETPTNLIMENKDIDFPFCLSWANETWSRRWDAQERQILIQQTHPPLKESWKKHYDYLIKAWTDPRAIKVDGKPVFVIYRPQRITKIDEMLEYWRSLARSDGLPGLYYVFQMSEELPNSGCLKSFDAAFQFQPFEAVNSPTVKRSPLFKLFRCLPERHQDMLRRIRKMFVRKPASYDYDLAWKKIVEVRTSNDLTTYPGAFVDWDNTARYKTRATIFLGATPSRFGYWFAKLVESMAQRNLPEKFIFFNAWNEWAESAYLEPDERFGYQYLEAVKSVLDKVRYK